MTDTEVRLNDLERSHRLWRRLAVAGWALVVLAGLAAAANPGEETLHPDTVFAREITIQQKDSKYFIHMLGTKEGAILEMLGDRGETGIKFAVDGKRAEIKLTASPASDHSIHIYAPKDGEPTIILKNPDNSDETTLRPGLAVLRGPEKAACKMGMAGDSGPFIELTDKSGKTLWKQ